jgi:hypothetical protein
MHHSCVPVFLTSKVPDRYVLTLVVSKSHQSHPELGLPLSKAVHPPDARQEALDYQLTSTV